MMIQRMLVLGTLLALTSGLAAQTHKDTRHGFQIKPPKGFGGVPVPPGESFMLAKFANENVDSGKDWRERGTAGFTVTLYRGRGESSLDSTWRELESRHGAVEKEKSIKIARTPAAEKHFFRESANEATYVAMVPQDEGLFVFTGTSIPDRFDKYTREFSKAAKSFKRIDKDDAADREAELAQLSDQERFLREQIARLPAGWFAHRTERYCFLANADKDFVEELGEQIEAIRDVYEEIWVPTEVIDAISIVRVCASHQDYLDYGGREGTGGYWSPGRKELVIFDNPPRDFARAVLNHEAFHQYIYYFYGELSPASWYNEGTGDYFAGADMSKTYKIRKFADAPGGIGRSQTVKAAARMAIKGATGDSACTPLKDLLSYSQQEYYRNDTVHYAQGWALVHMLQESKKLKPKWKRIYGDYLKNLVASRHEVALELKKEAIEDAKKSKKRDVDDISEKIEYWYAQASGRHTNKIQRRAYDKTFEGWTDEEWDEFNEAYLEYASKL